MSVDMQKPRFKQMHVEYEKWVIYIAWYSNKLMFRVTRPLAASERGFTLLELLVVMMIIGLLAGYVAPRYFSQIGKSEVKATQAQIDAFDKALEAYRLDIGRYPLTEQGLAALMNRPVGLTKWQGPYLKKALPSDPWGNAYHYKQPGEHGDFDIFSYGRDGKPGGQNEDADIGNW